MSRSYGMQPPEFGPEYIIPKPFDPRVLLRESTAVAKAAMESGVAQEPVNLDDYREELERRLGKVHGVMRIMIHKAQQRPKRVVFPEGEETKILRAAQILYRRKNRAAHPARTRSRNPGGVGALAFSARISRDRRPGALARSGPLCR